ncbi:hypothetical protein NPX13_g255 [Xylaria arbuscula]|uniref:Uncharacterized protein n=1 Tax=Xylaria arbuscula TaxID=114810 RepID=A0A9W8NNL2_9PEZI|nr:hypothetical protein NPX13_g255 [Xylaria arbuscula]
MTHQLPNAVGRKGGEVLPPELMLEVINKVSDGWPEVWNSLRLTNHTWKFEVEKLFRQRHLPNLIIDVDLWHSRYEFRFKDFSDERATFVAKNYRIGPEDWKEIVSCLRCNSGDHFIICPEIRVVAQTELVELQDDYEKKALLIKWVPTVSALFSEERKVRQLAREETK